MKSTAIPFIAAGLVASVLPFSSAYADEEPSASPSASPSSSPSASPSASPTSSPTSSPSASPTSTTTSAAFSGYSSAGIASPVRLELYEPTIPLPTTPQLELDLGYAKVKGSSSTTTGRASFMWPGDAVGEGLKTFVEQLGLPSQLGQDGYPVQVNSGYPSGTGTDAQQPVPGLVMTTTAADKDVRSTVGFSSNCDAGDGDPAAPAPDDDEGGATTPGIPLPELPLGLGGLADFLNGVTGLAGLPALEPGGGSAVAPRTASRGTASAKGADDTSDDKSGEESGEDSEGEEPEVGECQLPAALAALVDVGGYVADTHSVADAKTVTTTSRSALGDIKLAGGIVTLSGISAKSVSSSDGVTGTSTGRADYGTMTIAGQTFGIGPEGFVAAGAPQPIPGLPDDPAAALAALGITITLPTPTYKAAGDKASGVVEGLIVTVDTKVLSPALKQLPMGQLLAPVPFPPDAAILKGLLTALPNLSPKVVLRLGYTTSQVDTVQKIPIPTAVPDNDPGATDEESGEEAEGDGAAGGAAGAGAAAGAVSGGVPPASGGAGSTTADGALTDAELTSGLPPLFSMPGMLMVAAIGGALFAGSYVRRLGALVLGGGGPCAHGLDSGLPDLRKVQ